tara:strand:- start:4260 stop:4625 length:366 start_codon:yes stop_codon:yes gene_type:complete
MNLLDEIDSDLLQGTQRKKLLTLLRRGGAVTGITVHVRKSEDSETRGTVDPWGRVEWSGYLPVWAIKGAEIIANSIIATWEYRRGRHLEESGKLATMMKDTLREEKAATIRVPAKPRKDRE